ncbi:hypothetical protein PFISCL1PPCAC_24911, partial [Pristionchus fissidentatus]
SNAHIVMCLPFPLSITTAIVAITVIADTTVKAKLGSNAYKGEYECCAIQSTSSSPSLDTKESVVTISVRQKNAVLKPSSTTAICNGDEHDVIFEWCMPKEAPASMMFIGDTWRTRAVVVAGFPLDEGSSIEHSDESGSSSSSSSSSSSLLFSLKTTCRSTNVSSVQTVRVNIEHDETDAEALEILINPSLFERWTRSEREIIVEKLSGVLTAASLTPEKTRVVVIIHVFERLPIDGRWRVVFHVEEQDGWGGFVSLVRVRDAIGILRARLTTKNEMKIEKIQPFMCQLSCSGHGLCDAYTKKCVCESGWLPSPLSMLRSGGRIEDCSWSTMTMLSFLVVLIASFGLLVLATKKHKSKRSLLLSRRATRRRQRYEHLRSDEGINGGGRRSRQRQRSVQPPTLAAFPPRSWSSSSLSSDDCGDLVPIRRGAP